VLFECRAGALRVGAAAQQALAWERAATVLQRIADGQRSAATFAIERASQARSRRDPVAKK